MSQRLEKTFVVRVPRAEAWHAFVDGGQRSQWEAESYEIDPVPGGKFRWVIGGHPPVEGEVYSVDPERSLRYGEPLHGADASGELAHEVSVTFEDVAGGTRVTITQSGFGDGGDWDERLESNGLGWQQAIADLVVLLEHGLAPKRFVEGTITNFGMFALEGPGGLEVQAVRPGSYAERAGLRRGDLVLRVADVPVFTRPELWVLERQHQRQHDGDELAIEFVRDRQLERAVATT